MADPMLKLDPQGKAPILSYNVPEPTSYSGRNGIVLDFGDEPPEKIFTDAALKPPGDARTPIDKLTAVPADSVAEALRVGDPKMFPNIKAPAATHAGLFSTHDAAHRSPELDVATTSVLARGLRSGVVKPRLDKLVDAATSDGEGTAATSLPAAVRGSVLADAALADTGVRPHVTDVSVEHIAEQLRAGRRLNVYRSLWGEYVHTFLPEPRAVRPQLVLVETYRLSSYLGQYGAGRTLKTFSLLPGEKTTISVKTYRKSESDFKSSSSVLDSFTKESADDFETSVSNEQSDKQAHQESFEYHAEAEASASWGWGSAKISGGVKGGSASQREEFSKNVSNAVNKHAAKASSKRDVQVNTSSEVKQESGEETSISRQIENINVGRTLNFVFRQMNQEHIAILHLVDVRVAFWNGYAESVEEVPLSRLDALLGKYVREERREEVRKMIRGQLETVFDHRDELVTPPVVEDKVIAGDDRYLRFRKDVVSVYEDETGNKLSVPGVILNVEKIVMRTEGIIVDALLGQGNALDDYSQGLQQNMVRQGVLENDERQLRIDHDQLANEIVADADDDKAKVFRQVFPSAVALPGRISVSAADDGLTVSTTDAAPHNGGHH